MATLAFARERGHLAWFGGHQRCFIEPLAGVHTPAEVWLGQSSPQRAIVWKPLLYLVLLPLDFALCTQSVGRIGLSSLQV